jgi:RNA polymerase II transcription mediator complex subunit 9.
MGCVILFSVEKNLAACKRAIARQEEVTCFSIARTAQNTKAALQNKIDYIASLEEQFKAEKEELKDYYQRSFGTHIIACSAMAQRRAVMQKMHVRLVLDLATGVPRSWEDAYTKIVLNGCR